MADVATEIRGRLGLITLNRPEALNALTHGMVGTLQALLDDWAADDRIGLVAIRGAGERAFCAGGDIRWLYETGRPGGEQGRATFGFYADEYRLNTRIKRYPKPYVALIDGIVMGGGVGVSIHAARRIAGDRTRFAMPETGIGLFPDVGGTWFLPRMPGETGMWIGLTGARLGPVDAVRAGVADHYLPSDRFDALIGALAALDPADPQALDRAIAAHAREPEGPSILAEHGARIDRLFAGDSVEAILAALAADGHDWSAAQRAAILARSPGSTRLAFRQIREGRTLDFEACMTLEYRLARFCMTRPDFYEGVRTTIIDKGERPAWSPATLAEADEAYVAPAFAPLGAEELTL
ncbi:enoyl-CoA hydratase/isomerase family protein [Paralimibaculum aggregatum]|uniref:3-hydroxyisobutyryl-CoA hydrolase n=1 Tax=Paralimibaculum aggregatum TaxID=3036245 RepID=A0ABQ6LFS7_9RHOB|nr:enoyl-CoA hydratase/isomerase family protein [Limibaculum sp. NKW23]GMG81266.1 enoyl-CoA hydratase/isomerase family protein [Limibaculum sp. NKW23]